MPVSKIKFTKLKVSRTKWKWTPVIFIAVALLIGCIEKFNPGLEDYDELLVIEGSVIKEDSLQKVKITRSSPVSDPEYHPIAGCQVSVEDNSGNVFVFEDKQDGSYETHIPEQYLNYNAQFKLKVITPDNNNYESEYEPILESSPVDSIFYEEEPYQSSSEIFANGLRFYANLKAPEGNTRNYRWTLKETWEYRAPYIPEAEYLKDSDTIINLPFSDSLTYCWVTSPVKGLYSSSTQNLVVNEKKKIPLNYVGETSPKIHTRYSLLVKQYALSENAYAYWNRNKVASSESGGLYQTQPSQSISNIININNPDEIVLGYFWASSYTEKRIFYDGPFPRSQEYYKYCDIDTFPSDKYEHAAVVKLFDIDPDPIDTVWVAANPLCFDCTLGLGTNKKPDFW